MEGLIDVGHLGNMVVYHVFLRVPLLTACKIDEIELGSQ
jgi:hypothetical protein